MKQQLIRFYKIIRFKNIFLYVLLETLLYFVLFHKHFNLTDGWLFLVLSMVCFSAFSNIQNNILDYELDQNKNNFTDFNRKTFLFWSFICGVTGALFGLIAFNITENSQLFYALLIIPILILLYNYYLKKWPLIGNFLIAFAITYAIYIPLAYTKGININNPYFRFLLVMSLLLNFLRELVKDMEDAYFDRQFGYKTLPIINMRMSKILLTILSLLTWLVMFSYINIFNNTYFYALIVISFVLLSYSIIQVFKENFELATKLLKLLMLIGVFSIFFI